MNVAMVAQVKNVELQVDVDRSLLVGPLLDVDDLGQGFTNKNMVTVTIGQMQFNAFQRLAQRVFGFRQHDLRLAARHMDEEFDFLARLRQNSFDGAQGARFIGRLILIFVGHLNLPFLCVFRYATREISRIVCMI